MTSLRSVVPALSLGLLGSVLLASACGEKGVSQEEAGEAIARAICDAYFACDCTDFNSTFSSLEQCLADQEAEAQQAIDEGNAAGLTYDGDCVADWIGLLDVIDCKAGSELTVGEYLDVVETFGCKWFYGDQEGGQQCESLTEGPGDDCLQGYLCNDVGVCEQIEAVPGPGEACDTEFTTLCSGDALCLDADADGNPTCEVLPTTGQTCLGMLDLCAEGFVCNQTSKTCEPAPGDGDACAMTPIGFNQCAANLACDAGTCGPLPQGGESCTAQCADGFTCTAGTCAVDPPVVCSADAMNFGA